MRYILISNHPQKKFRYRVSPEYTQNSFEEQRAAIKLTTDKYRHLLEEFFKKSWHEDVNLLWFPRALEPTDGFSPITYLFFCGFLLRAYKSKGASRVIFDTDRINPQELHYFKELCNELNLEVEFSPSFKVFTPRLFKTKKLLWKVLKWLLFIPENLASFMLRPAMVGIFKRHFKSIPETKRVWKYVFSTSRTTPGHLPWVFNNKYNKQELKNLIGSPISSLFFSFTTHPNWLVQMKIKWIYALYAVMKLRTKDSFVTPDWLLTAKDRKKNRTAAKETLKQQKSRLTSENFFAQLDAEEKFFLNEYQKNISEDEISRYLDIYTGFSKMFALSKESAVLDAYAIFKNDRCFVSAAHSLGMKVISVANRIYTDTRVSNLPTKSELLDGRSLPDIYLVEDPISRDTLLNCGVSPEIIIGGDSVIADLQIKNLKEDAENKVLIVLQLDTDNEGIISAAQTIRELVPNASLEFLPHPYGYSHNKNLNAKGFRLLTIGSEVRYSDYSFCVSAYSSVGLKAIQKGCPVLWVPYTTISSLFMLKVIESFGVVSWSEEELKQLF